MKKHIPDEAVSKENSPSILEKFFDTDAKKEQKAFEEENYGDGVPKAVNNAVKRFISWVSFFSIVFLGFFTLIFRYLLLAFLRNTFIIIYGD